MKHLTPEWSGIVGLTGPAGIGKRRVSDLLYELYEFRTFAIADNVREALLAFDPLLSSDLSLAQLVHRVGWDEAKTHRIHGPEVRRLMDALGSDVGRAFFGESCWTELLEEDIAGSGGYSPKRPIVVDDLHFEDEARWIRRLGGSVWQVSNPKPTQRLVTTTQPPISPDLIDHVIVLTGDSKDVVQQIDRILNPAATAATYRKEVAA